MTAAAIDEGHAFANLPTIRADLENKFTDLGQSLTLPPFELYIDSDGDGILNIDDPGPVLVFSKTAPNFEYWSQPAGFMGKLYAAHSAANGSAEIHEITATSETLFGGVAATGTWTHIEALDSTLISAAAGTGNVHVTAADGSTVYTIGVGQYPRFGIAGHDIATTPGTFGGSTTISLVSGSSGAPKGTLTTPSFPEILLGAGLSGNDDIVVAGGYSGNTNYGVAYVFDKSGPLLHTLTSPAASDFEFGAPIVVSGSSIFVSSAKSSYGHVYEFDSSTGQLVWTYQDESPNGYGQIFGNAVAANDRFLIVSAAYSSVGANSYCGKVFIYSRTSRLLLHTILDPRPPPSGNSTCGDYFGWTVALIGTSGIAATDLRSTLYYFDYDLNYRRASRRHLREIPAEDTCHPILRNVPPDRDLRIGWKVRGVQGSSAYLRLESGSTAAGWARCPKSLPPDTCHPILRNSFEG